MMKRIYVSVLLSIFVIGSAFSQQKLKEKDVIGEWRLVIDVDIEEEIEEEMEDENVFARAIASSVSGFVSTILEEINIEMKFHEGGKLKITVDAYDETEVEWGEWFINRDGELVIVQDDHDWDDDDDVWLREGKRLVSYDKSRSGRLERQEVYLERL